MAVLGRLCVSQYCLAYPDAMLWVLPVVIGIGVVVWLRFIRLRTKEELESFRKGRRLDRLIFSGLRILAMVALLIAVATPYITKETTVQGTPSVTIVADNSSSFEMFDKSVIQKIESQLKGFFPVNVKYIAFGGRSPIADGIMQNMRGNDQLLVVSDGQNTHGREMGEALVMSSLLNTTIHGLKLSPIKKDAGVVIEGPHQVIAKSETSFQAKVSNIGNLPYNLEIFIDGDQGFPDAQGNFHWRFSSGFHKIMARIKVTGDDYFPQNNVFYKTVKAVPRPKIGFISAKVSPLGEALSDVYDVAMLQTIPDSLEAYHAVVLNNINANAITNAQLDRLSAYLSDRGKGLLVIGGDNAFDKGNYKSSYMESILPAQVGVGKRRPGSEINVVIVIDISESTGLGVSGQSANTKIDVEKSLAVNILNQLSEEYRAGVVAFNHKAYVLAQMEPMGNQLNLSRRIASLKDTGGTLVSSGLQKANALLQKSSGSKNIIVISDGITQQPGDALQRAKEMAAQGIRVYTVGVGENTDEAFMKLLAANGGGLYFKPDESSRLKLVLGETPAEQEDSMQVFIADNSHWITKANLNVKAKLTGHNFIVPKSQGRKLVTTAGDRPIIVVGRYGLGRIGVIATDDGSKWAGQFLQKENSKLITRTLNWVIGDFTKEAQLDMRAEDTAVGESTVITMVSSSMPEIKGLDFVKTDVGLYSAVFRPEEEGFFSVGDALTGVSYPLEYRKLGQSPDLEELVTVSGGYLFNPDDIEGMKEKMVSLSRRVTQETFNFRVPLIVLSVLLFLIDIFFRKWRENRVR
ncbi:VWA domain-containing protein [Candidatus Woesearchaeota archaeon]|nr:VWA domain-containing protein [Candidatus Woesearchaeota archaeon]